MARLPRPGQDDGVWGDILNDFLAVSHMDDGTVRVEALPEPQVSDGSITPAKLSISYVPASEKGNTNGVASLDASGRIPIGQMPSGSIASDASATTKGVVQLAGDLSGTADAPTVPSLAIKYEKPSGGIPETDLSSDVVTKLNTGGAIGDASTTTKGLVLLAGDLGGTADAPTVPGLATKVPQSAKGVANGVASLDATGRVPVTQLPAGYEADATTTTKGIVQLAGDLGGTAAAPTVPGLANKANDSEVVHKIGNETITGLKVFTSVIEIPGPPVKSTDATNKSYVDGLVASAGAADASTTTKGIIQLAGDLAGTAAAPTVPGKINTSEKGAANGVATLNASGKLTAAQMPNVSRLPAYSNTGPLIVNAGTHRFYNDSGAAWTIAGVRANVGIPASGTSVIIDVNVDGTTIFTAQNNRPAIAAGVYTSGKVTNMTITSIPNGSFVTVDVDQVGSVVAGNDLTVQIEVY